MLGLPTTLLWKTWQEQVSYILLEKEKATFEWTIFNKCHNPLFVHYFSDSNENKENEGVEESADTVLDLPDVNTIAGILETIAISWAGIKDQLDKVYLNVVIHSVCCWYQYRS